MYLHVPMVTFVMNPNTSASCIRFLYERSNTYFQLSRSTLLRQTRNHNTHENKTLLVLSCVLPSSQKTAGYVSRTKKKGKSGKKNPATRPCKRVVKEFAPPPVDASGSELRFSIHLSSSAVAYSSSYKREEHRISKNNWG